ncbi:iron-containing alcohol dehydrogenase [Ruminococcus callidus]|uniref:iron-containing alcohol dehydrogenase n=1 Tax=Ruminococcus callidus TaxID=40519 RepID=UPI0039A35119
MSVSLTCHNTFLVTGGSSMLRTGVIDRAKLILEKANISCTIYSGIGKNPTFEEVFSGVEKMKIVKPDAVIAIGGGSAMDAAKGMLLFYEFPFLTSENVLEMNTSGKIPTERKTQLICISSTSGTASEVTRGTVLTDTVLRRKIPIMTDCLRPDLAILDAELTMTMPDAVTAETGLDALTHAIEAYTNHNLDDFDEGLCKSAIEGILEWLPISFHLHTLESREKMHHYQAMAGIGFANVGLGMVHGIAHAFGAVFDMSHGLTNAVILPYVLRFNCRNATVQKKLEKLSYHCHVEDIITAIDDMRADFGIPSCFADVGITEAQFQENYELLLENSMLGATKVNPVPVTKEIMKQMLNAVYYRKEIDF